MSPCPLPGPAPWGRPTHAQLDLARHTASGSWEAGRRLPERPRSQRSRERPVRDPAEVSGPGRFSRRRGRGPLVNYLLDNILPKVPVGRSRLPCK